MAIGLGMKVDNYIEGGLIRIIQYQSFSHHI